MLNGFILAFRDVNWMLKYPAQKALRYTVRN